MKTRDIYFDNLKSILIFLVVLGHFANINISNPLMEALNNVIYTFHMPLFVFVAGYFSKNITTHRAAEIENLIFPYIVFQLLNYAFKESTGLGRGSINIFVPAYQNWFLIGLFIWRLLIPYLNLFNRKYLALFTFLLFCANILFNDVDVFLKFYRIIYYFPIFIIGFFCSDLKQLLDKLSRFKYLFIAFSLISLLVIFVVTLVQFDTLYTKISTDFAHDIDNISITRLFNILGLTFFSLLISFGLLFIIPKNTLKITGWGKNTLNIFLAQMFFVFPINNFLPSLPNYLILPISIFSSVIICMLLSTGLAKSILDPLTKLKALTFKINSKIM